MNYIQRREEKRPKKGPQKDNAIARIASIKKEKKRKSLKGKQIRWWERKTAVRDACAQWSK